MVAPQLREIRRAYGFDEVAIAPGAFTVNPELTSTDFSIDGITLTTPILTASSLLSVDGESEFISENSINY